MVGPSLVFQQDSVPPAQALGVCVLFFFSQMLVILSADCFLDA